MEERAFWSIFRSRFGEASEYPPSYWSPGFGISPSEVSIITPAQLNACWEHAEKGGR